LKCLDSVPFEALDQFYFDAVRHMPDSLQELALDLRVLRKRELAGHITTLRDLYTNDYLFMPWLLDDIFDLPPEGLQAIGEACILLALSCVMLDRLVDRQMPDISVIPLAQQHLLLKANAIFYRRLKSQDQFWDYYFACLADFGKALALEADLLGSPHPVYTYQAMREVCTGKAGPLRAVACASALSAGDSHWLSIIDPALNNLVLADQLSDDALDWREDLQAGRYTLPVLQALEAGGDSPEAISSTKIEELEARLERHAILANMVEQAISLLEESITGLDGAGLGESKLCVFLRARTKRFQRQERYYQAIRLFEHLSRSLTKRTKH
jgi:hypothetical protein